MISISQNGVALGALGLSLERFSSVLTMVLHHPELREHFLLSPMSLNVKPTLITAQCLAHSNHLVGYRSQVPSQ